MASCRDCPCDSASSRDSRQEAKSRQKAKSHGQSLQEAISQAQQSRQEARDRGQSRRKPNMTDSLCRKRKLADSFILCGGQFHRSRNRIYLFLINCRFFSKIKTANLSGSFLFILFLVSILMHYYSPTLKKWGYTGFGLSVC